MASAQWQNAGRWLAAKSWWLLAGNIVLAGTIATAILAGLSVDQREWFAWFLVVVGVLTAPAIYSLRVNRDQAPRVFCFPRHAVLVSNDQGQTWIDDVPVALSALANAGDRYEAQLTVPVGYESIWERRSDTDPFWRSAVDSEGTVIYSTVLDFAEAYKPLALLRLRARPGTVPRGDHCVRLSLQKVGGNATPLEVEVGLYSNIGESSFDVVRPTGIPGG